MRKLLSYICILGISSSSFAQTKDTSWSNLNGITAGQEIQIVETNSKKESGVFVRVSDSAISFMNSSGEQSVQKQDVRTVKLRKADHRLRNTLIGAGVGAGTLAGLGAAAGDSSRGFSSRSFGALAGGLFGFLGGAVAGFLVPTHRFSTVYSANSR